MTTTMHPLAADPDGTSTRAGTLDVILPGGVDDPHRPSGGNHYDRRLCDELRRLGWSVRERHLPGAWPYPDARARAGLASALAPSDAHPVLVDGLIAVGAADLVVAVTRTRPVVIVMHMPFGPYDPALRTGERRLLTRVTAIVATSRWTKRQLDQAYALPPRLVRVVAPGTDRPPEPAVPGDGSRLLCVAAITRAKGYDVLLDALAALTDRRWRCTCVGALDIDAVFAADLRARVRRMGLSDRIAFTGALGRSGVAAAYARADLLVLSSRAESFGMVLTEALAYGLPVVSTDVGGVREALGSESPRPGLLLPAGDPSALAAALRRWLDDPGLRSRLRMDARARAEGLPGWNRTAASLADVLVGLTADAEQDDGPAGRTEGPA